MAYKWRIIIGNTKRQLAVNNHVCDPGNKIMRIIISLLFILSNEVLNRGSAKEHIHFKIHVPEIIKHQIHTKTVFIHIHKPDISTPPKKSKPKEEAPKKKKTYKKTHHEDWSSWSNYGYQSDHDDKWGENEKNHVDDGVHKDLDYRNKPFAQPHRDSYMPMQHNNKPDHLKSQHGDVMGYSYPPQYEVTENVKEIENNDLEPYVHTFEEGYSKGGESASGHIYSGDVMKYYEDKHEEGSHSVEDYKNESKEKTHAGRYFVDDSEYHQNNKVEKRNISPRIFVLP